MMKQQIVFVLIVLSLALVASNPAPSAKSYWNAALNGGPMPDSIKKLLIPDWGVQDDPTDGYCFCYEPNCACNNFDNNLKSKRNNTFFLEKDLQFDTKKNFTLVASTSHAHFLPRRAANLLPLSSKKLPQLLEALSIDPKSGKAKQMKKTVHFCEALLSPSVKRARGSRGSCLTSLESMIDFSKTYLGQNNINVKAITSESEKSVEDQSYKIENLERMSGGEEAVACHKQHYPFAVFHCHLSYNTNMYQVSLVGVDGTKVNSIAICHQDTSKWDPNYLAFQVLNIKPGGAPICHFMPGDHILWVKDN